MDFIRLLVFSSCLIACGSVFGQGDPILKVGAGVRSCAQFQRDYANSKMPEIIEEMYYNWTQGYLSGFLLAVIGGGGEVIDLDAHDANWQKSFIREYCQNNPLSPYSEAAGAVLQELIKANR